MQSPAGPRGTEDHEHRAEPAHWETVSRPYRRNPGGLWWLALLAVPLLLALVGSLTGQQFADATVTTASSPAASTASTPAAPVTSASPSATTGPQPLTITRDGNTVTVAGSVADDATRLALVDMLTTTLGSDVTLVETLAATDGAPTFDVEGLRVVALQMSSHPDLAIRLEGSVATLTGTVFEDEKGDLADVATMAFPGATIDNQLTVGTPAYWCEQAKTSRVTAVIPFEAGRATVTEAGAQSLDHIAATAKRCPDLTVTVAGNSDNLGRPATNTALSLLRAKQVAAILLAKGVKAAAITTIGQGSSNPIATNETAEGRALNRRVDVTIN